MKKAELIHKLAKNTGITQASAFRIYSALLLIISEELKAEGATILPGICKFTHLHKAARKGRSPVDGSVIDIAAKTVVKPKVLFPLSQQL